MLLFHFKISNMKKLSILLGLFATIGLGIAACNNSGKENVDTADSINSEKRDGMDTVDNRAGVTADEESSKFLVRVADAGMSEVEFTKLAEQKATTPEIKQFATMLWNDHTQLNQQVKQLAQERNITLPATTSEDHNKMMTDVQAKTGKSFDKAFIDKLIANHNKSIDLFEKAVKNVNDAGVRTFADNTLPKLRMHRDSAQALEKKYW
jgi:putative membrane protein